MSTNKYKTLSRSIIAAMALGTLAAMPASAQEYPSRPIVVTVPFGAGGFTDTLARETAREMGEYLKVNIVVGNKTGGSGTIGLAQIAQSSADGYALGVVPAAPLVNQPNLRKLPYDAESFDYICQVFSSPLVLVTKSGSGFKSLAEVVDYARQNPGKVTYGSPGPGTLPHLAMEDMLDKLGIQLRHVPFPGGEAGGVTALMGGHIELFIATATLVSDRELPAVAVFASQRLEQLPELPTALEQGFDVNSALWGGIIAPKGLGKVEKSVLEEACAFVTHKESFIARLRDLGTDVTYKDAAAFHQYVKSVSDTNAVLIKKLGLAQ